MSTRKNLSNEENLKILDNVQALSSQGKYRSAMNVILEILDEIPGDEFVLNLANLIIYTNQTRSQAYTATEPLTSEYLSDTRLDSIFCECSKCSSTWVLNPMIKQYASVSVMNPLGAYCPRCKKIFCRNCYRKSNLTGGVGSPSKQFCPNCNTELTMLTEPNGRKPRQTRRHSKPIKFFIFLREGPVPPTAEYLQKILRLISPDALQDQPQFFVAPVPNWNGDQKELTSLMYAIAAQRKYSLDEIETAFFTPDENGNHYCIAKVY